MRLQESGGWSRSRGHEESNEESILCAPGRKVGRTVCPEHLYAGGRYDSKPVFFLETKVMLYRAFDGILSLGWWAGAQ